MGEVLLHLPSNTTNEEPKAEETSTEPQARPVATPPTPIRQGKGISATQVAQIERLLKETGSDRDKLLTYFGVDSLAMISVAEYPRVIRSLEHKRAA